MNKQFVIDTIERSGWTIVQTIAAALATASAAHKVADWRGVLVLGGVAGAFAVAKAFGVKGAVVAAALELARAIPAVAKVEDTPVGQEIVKDVDQAVTAEAAAPVVPVNPVVPDVPVAPVNPVAPVAAAPAPVAPPTA